MRRVPLVLILLLCGIASSFFFLPRPETNVTRAIRLAQDPTEARRLSCAESDSVTLDTIDTFDWRSCSVDLQGFWSQVGIPAGTYLDSSSVWKSSSVFGDLDGDGKNERILRLLLRSSTDQAARFIILKRAASKDITLWKTAAYLDAVYFHLEPDARVVSNGRGHWLVITNNEVAWGSDIFQANDIWYAFEGGELQEALTLPSEGKETYFSRPTISREIKAKVT